MLLHSGEHSFFNVLLYLATLMQSLQKKQQQKNPKNTSPKHAWGYVLDPVTTMLFAEGVLAR